jgi:adenylate kinase family enzyme
VPKIDDAYRSHRIHIFGASGSGTTTLGRALAEHLQCPHFDTDTYFWMPTEPPFTQQRACSTRKRYLMGDLTAHDTWVLSGSLCGWGDVAISLFTLVVFLWLPRDLRMVRLCRRERERYGERIMPGGDMYGQSQAFLQWAAAYDDGDVTMRSRALHEQWLSLLPSPVVRIEGDYSTQECMQMLLAGSSPGSTFTC